MTADIAPVPAPPVFQPALMALTPKAAKSVLECFTAQINVSDGTKIPRGVWEAAAGAASF